MKRQQKLIHHEGGYFLMQDNKDVVRREDREDYNSYKEDKEFRKRTRKDTLGAVIALIVFEVVIYLFIKYGEGSGPVFY